MFLLKRDGVYHLEYFDEEENRTRRVSTKQRIKRDALKFLYDFESLSKTKKVINHILLEDYKKQYCEYVKINLSYKYYLNVDLSFRQLIEYTGNVPISKLSYQKFELFFMEKFNKTKQGALTYFRILKSAFNKAVQWEYLTYNPLLKIKLPKIPQNKPIFINDVELKQIINCESDQTLKDIYLFAFYSGCRINEIMNLKWSSIDFMQRIIRIKNDEDFTTKSKKERVIPINNKLLENLQSRLSKIKRIDNDECVFTNSKGKKFRSDTVSKWFKEAVVAAAVDTPLESSIHFHTLRHSFASCLVQKGASIYEVSKLLGHSDIKTTEIYAHLTPDNLRSAVELLK